MTKQANQSLRECPMCTELISVRAKKCKHCGEYFESPSKETVKKETVKKETVNRTEQTGTNETEIANKVVEYHKIGLLALKGNYINLFFVTALYTFALSSLPLTIIGFVLIPPIMYGYMAYSLNLVRNKKSDYGLFFSGFGLKKYILSALILCALIGVYLAGLFLFLLPGLYLITWWYFAAIILVDTNNNKNMGLIEILTKSRELVRKLNFWPIMVFSTLAFALELLTFVPVVGFVSAILGPYFIAQSIALYDKALKS